MPNAVLVGAFGQGNPGDEALCAVFRDALAGAGYDAAVVSRDPRRTAAIHRCRALPATGRHVAAAVRRADLVVIGGGTIFKGLHTSTGRRRNGLLWSTAGLVAAARAWSTPVAMVGVGAADVHGAAARNLARWIVRTTDLLVLRDEESAAVLASAGVPPPFRVGADPAWTVLDEPPASHGRSGDVVVAVSHLAVSHLAGGSDLAARLAAALRPLTTERRVTIQPWQIAGGRAGDADLAAEIARRLDGRAEVVRAPADLAEARASYVGASLVVGMRFHALVAAAAAGARFLAIAHEPKLAGVARRMEQPAVPPNAPEAVLTRAVATALDGPPPSPAAVRAEMARAEEGLALLRLLAGGGRIDEPSEVSGLTLSDGGGCW